MTIIELAQQSLDIQDACNLRAVVNAFGRAMATLWDEAGANNHSTEWVNNHPIVTLFIDKCSHLNGTQFDNMAVSRAYDAVHNIVEGGNAMRWDDWLRDAAKIIGVTSLDGDQDADGYSLDFAHAAYKKGLTPAQYTKTVNAHAE
jgi:hypothetical protein